MLDDLQASPTLAPNIMEVEQGEGSYARYLHLQNGSGQGVPGLDIEPRGLLGLAGNVGTGLDTAFQIHFEVSTQPLNAQDGVTYPVVFRDFERQEGGTWVPVEVGGLRAGDVVRVPE